MNTKTCGGCGDDKPVADFSRNRTSRDGLYSLCRDCKSKRAAAFRAANVEKIREAKRAYQEENADKVKAKRAAYYSANAEQVKAKVAKWVKDNPENVKANRDRYRSANRPKVKASRAKTYRNNPFEYQCHVGASRARRAGRGHAVPGTEEWRCIVALYAQCAEMIATTGVKYEVDHIRPFSHGGGHFLDNLQILTASEHRAKSNEDLRLLKQFRETHHSL